MSILAKLSYPAKLNFIRDHLDDSSIFRLLESGIVGSEFLRDPNAEIWEILFKTRYPDITKEPDESYRLTFRWVSCKIVLNTVKLTEKDIYQIPYKLLDIAIKQQDINLLEYIYYYFTNTPTHSTFYVKCLMSDCLQTYSIKIKIAIIRIAMKVLDLSVMDVLLSPDYTGKNQPLLDTLLSYGDSSGDHFAIIAKMFKLSSDDITRLGDSITSNNRLLNIKFAGYQRVCERTIREKFLSMDVEFFTSVLKWYGQSIPNYLFILAKDSQEWNDFLQKISGQMTDSNRSSLLKICPSAKKLRI